MFVLYQGLGEIIRHLFLGIRVQYDDQTVRDSMADGVVPNIDMFGPLVNRLRLCQSGSAFIVNMKWGGIEFESRNWFQNVREKMAEP
jgi:hypothetical protein